MLPVTSLFYVVATTNTQQLDSFSQLATMSDACYDQVITMLSWFDRDAIDEKGNALVAAPTYISVKKRDLVPREKLRLLCSLPDNKIEAFLDAVVNGHALLQFYHDHHGVSPDEVSMNQGTFFTTLNEYINHSLSGISLSFWVWKVWDDVRKCQISTSEFKNKLIERGFVSAVVATTSSLLV